MAAKQNPLALKILVALQDEPFEHVMATLGELQVFFLVEHAGDPVATVDEITGFMRASVREIVEKSTAEGSSGNRLLH